METTWKALGSRAGGHWPRQREQQRQRRVLLQGQCPWQESQPQVLVAMQQPAPLSSIPSSSKASQGDVAGLCLCQLVCLPLPKEGAASSLSLPPVADRMSRGIFLFALCLRQ